MACDGSMSRASRVRAAAWLPLAMLLLCGPSYGGDPSGSFEASAELRGSGNGLVTVSVDYDFRLYGLFLDPKLSRATRTDHRAGTTQFARTALAPPGVPDAAGSGTNQNRDGTCGVGYQDAGNGTPYHAFRWTEATGPVDLGTLDAANNASRTSSALATSDDCNVIVGYSDTTSTFVQHAFRWSAAGGMVDLGAPAGATRQSRAFGVSGDGNVVVGDADFRDPNDPFATQLLAAYRWSATGGFENLGGFNSIATAVTQDGGVIVGTHGSAGGAFRWTPAGGTQTIGALPGDSVAVATGVSDNGQVVVGISGVNQYRGSLGWDAGVGTRAFRWTAAGGMQDLRELMVAAGVDMTGVALLSVTGLSADGQWITGEATTPTTPAGETVGYIAQYCDDAIAAPCAQIGGGGAASFALDAATAALTTAAGQSATTTLTITPSGGFSGAVSFACSGLPTGASCSFAPASVTPAGGAVSTTLTIATDGGPVALWLREHPGTALALLLPVFGLARLGAWHGASPRSLRAALWMLLIAVAALGVACGGGGSDDDGSGSGGGGGGTGGAGSNPPPAPPPTGTPAGTSAVTVTATSGSGAAAVTRTATLTLTVTR